MRMKKDWFILTIAFTLASLILYGYYFISPTKFDIVYKNWDGPSYVIAARSLYVPAVATTFNTINSKDIRSDWTFLPAHFPLYPLLIRFFSGVGYYRAMIMLSLAFSLGAVISFYELLRRNSLTKHPLLLSLPFVLLPPRWYIISHVGSSEPLFLFFLIWFLHFVLQKKNFLASTCASLCLLTRPQGALLGVAMLFIALSDFVRTKNLSLIIKRYYSYLLMPLTLFGIFLFYRMQTGSFWAFFSAIAIFGHTSFVPFSTFTYLSANVETFWQEVNVFDYIMYLTAVIILLRSRLRDFGIIALVLFVPLPFLHHSDISRYALPLVPFALIAFREALATREFNLALLLMSPAILRYTINFMAFNHGI